MPKPKPEGWEKDLKDLIAQGKNHKESETALKATYGDEEGKVGASTYQRHKKALTGGPEIDGKLKDIKDIRADEKPSKPPRPAWTKQKQSAADTSKLAHLINKGMYSGLMPFCKNKALKEEDVQDINLGGAVVGAVQYYVPELNLEHPIVMLLTRGIMLYLKFKQICNRVGEIVEKIKHIGADGVKGGVKPGFADEK